MKTNGRKWLTTAVAVIAVFGASEARGQFFRGASNPYGQSGSGNLFSSGSSNAYSQQPSLHLNGFPFTNSSFLFGSPRSSTYGSSSSGIKNPLAPTVRSGYMNGNTGSYAATSTYSGSSGPATGALPDVPRKAFDRWVVDRDRQAANGPEAQKKQAELLHSLTSPSATEISSGAALNMIVEALEPLAGKLKTMQPTAIDEAFLKRLNFTRGVGSIGLLRQQGKIDWPAVVQNLSPKEEAGKVRQQIETRFLDAYNQVDGGEAAEAENLKSLLKAIEQLGDLASGQAQSMSFAENVEIKRFLKSLEDSVVFLKQPDAAEWLPGKRRVPSKSVQELVLRMLDKKVRFAPAVVGNDGAYNTMHRALANLYVQATGPAVGMNR